MGALRWFMGCVGWWVVWVGKEVVGGSAMQGSVTKHLTRSVAFYIYEWVVRCASSLEWRS